MTNIKDAHMDDAAPHDDHTPHQDKDTNNHNDNSDYATPVLAELHHKIDKSQKISNLEHIKSQILQLQDSYTRMQKKQTLDQKYKFDKLVYDPVTQELCRASEVKERRQQVLKRFKPKIKKQPLPPVPSEEIPPPPSPHKQAEFERHKRRFTYYQSVVREINQEDVFKKEFQKKMEEERRQRLKELARIRKEIELEEKAIRAMQERIKEDKAEEIQAAWREREERQKVEQEERRRKSLARSVSGTNVTGTGSISPQTAADLERMKRERQREEYRQRQEQILSKINYPKLKTRKLHKPAPTDFQVEIKEKEKEKREPHPNTKAIDYLGEMRRLRIRAAKRKKVLKKRKAARERQRQLELEAARRALEQNTETDSVVTEEVAVEEVVEEVLIPTSKKRQFILQEIYSTEKDYVTHLKNVFERYADPIKEQSLLPETFQEQLFGSLRVIRDVHVNMMEELDLFQKENYLEPLEPGAPRREKGLSLGNIFLEIAPAFKQYTEYINDYEVIFDIVTSQSKKYKKFQKFLQTETELRMAENDRMTALTTYLILPIQRIPRYRMLLEDLVKNTSPEHPDHSATKEALQLIIDIADYCNAMKKEKQNRERMEQLIKQLRLKDLSHPKRRFIREGVVKSRDAKKVKECVLYLFSDVCVVKFKKLKKIVLFDGAAQDYKIEVLDGAEPAFQLVSTQTPAPAYTFICQSNYDLNEWVSHFELTCSLVDPSVEAGTGLENGATTETDALTATTSDLISSALD